MDDKTLLLAIDYASCFRWQAVLLGVFAANASNPPVHRVLPILPPSIVLMQHIRMTAATLLI
jgi:putative Ca2+/H+ antiporter (TMEM165/GDT1 family)